MFTMSEERARFIDASCKILAVLGVVIGGGWTVLAYLNARAHEAETAAIEARKPFEAQRLEVYLRATTVAGTLAKSKDQKERTQAEKEFWTLYWGPLAIVKDSKVAEDMVRIGNCLNDKNNCDRGLEMLALNLDHDCQASIANAWRVDLAPKKAD